MSKRKLVLAIEEMAADNDPFSDESDINTTRLEAEEAVSDVVETESEVDEMSDSIKSSSADMETLDAIHHKMEESVEKGGGLSEDAAKMAEVAIESIYSRLGIKREGRIMPATESFKSTNSRLVATKIAMEDIKATGKKIWEAILKAFAWLKDKIEVFWTNLTKNLDALQKHVKTVLAQVRSIPKGAVKKEEMLKNASLAKALGEGDKANKETALAKIEATILLSDYGYKIANSLNSTTREYTAGDHEFNLQGLKKALDEAPEKKSFLGGVKIQIKDTEGKFAPSVTFSSEETSTAKEIEALDVKGMEEVLKSCLELMFEARNYKEIKKNNNDALKNLEKTIAQLSKEDSEESKSRSKDLKDIQVLVSDLIAKTSINFPSLAFKTINANLKYVEASIANLSGKDNGDSKYSPHILLLVMSANRLPENLNKGQIDNDKINELISGAAWAYCFAKDDEQGNQIMNAVSYSDAAIDRTTEINVFVKLELSAESEITTQRNKLNIKEKINPNSNGQVLQISRLQSSRSVSNFYEI